MATKIDRISELSSKNPNMVFTSLYHLINEELLRECHKEIDGRKATGVDEVTKDEYEANLNDNLRNLVERLKRKNYKPQPSMRIFIPKADGKLRPIGIAAYEDKLVQAALSRILTAVFEPKFQNSMYGYRPKRGCHDALRELTRQVETGKTNFVVEADIKGYFNNIEHEMIIKCIKFRLNDPNILWLVKKLLTAGFMVDGKREPTTKGTEQGNLASPIIANICMHYALALWFEMRFRKECKGESGLIIYADDFIATFQYRDEAIKFMDKIRERFAQLGLELEESKTRVVEFGRFAERDRSRRKEGKPETFDFLGFTHYCSRSKTGRFRMKRKTSKKKMRLRLKEMNLWLKANRHLRLIELIKALNLKLRGHYRYYGITDNSMSLNRYFYHTERLLFKWLNQRSQKRSYDWEGFGKMLKIFPLVKPKIYFSVYDGSW